MQPVGRTEGGVRKLSGDEIKQRILGELEMAGSDSVDQGGGPAAGAAAEALYAYRFATVWIKDGMTPDPVKASQKLGLEDALRQQRMAGQVAAPAQQIDSAHAAAAS